MNPNRRTLEGALQTPTLPPEAFAIIKEGTPKPQTQLAATAPARPQEPALSKPAGESVEPAKPRAQKERTTEVVASVPMTVRVASEIPLALLKASSERKLKKVRPYTQQDIVAEALQHWLQKNGYLPHKG
jgi:hypothetical protein